MLNQARLRRSLLLVLLALGVSAHAATYDLSPLTIPGIQTTPTGIADDGTVVGTTGIPSRGFVYDGNAVTLISYPGAAYTEMTGISPDGSILVGWYRDAPCVSPAVCAHGFFHQSSTYTSFDRPGAGGTKGRAVTNGGTIARFTWEPSAFRRSSGGSYTSITPSGARYTLAQAINASGHVVGQYFDSNLVRRAFHWNGSSVTTFAVPGSATGTTIPWGMNAVGLIVGVYGTGSGPSWKGFVRDGDTYTTIEYPGAVGTSVHAINASGTIVGSFWNADGSSGSFLGTPQ